MTALNISNLKKNNVHVIKGIKSSGSMVIDLGDKQSNARDLWDWALLFPALGSITILI